MRQNSHNLEYRSIPALKIMHDSFDLVCRRAKLWQHRFLQLRGTVARAMGGDAHRGHRPAVALSQGYGNRDRSLLHFIHREGEIHRANILQCRLERAGIGYRGRPLAFERDAIQARFQLRWRLERVVERARRLLKQLLAKRPGDDWSPLPRP